MKIAICQAGGRPGRKDRNLEIMARTAEEAARQGAGLLVFPELFLTGYNIGEGLRHLAETADGPAVRHAAAIARRTGTALLYGYPEKAGDRTYNAVRLIDKNGRLLANYRKTHLYGEMEKRHFQRGDTLVVATVGGVKTGLLICYDIEFPEAVRALALAGAELVAVPTALMKPHCRIARTVVPARAHENQLYVAYVNRCGREDDLKYCGSSCVVGPDGSDLVRAGTRTALLFARIEPERVKAARDENPMAADRRPALYAAPVEKREA